MRVCWSSEFDISSLRYDDVSTLRCRALSCTKQGGYRVCSSCIMRRGDVDCPHEHDGYDPSYIMEFRMLVRDSCKRCKGIVWSDVSRHDLP